MELVRQLGNNLLVNLQLVAGLVSFWVADLLVQRRLRSMGLEAKSLAGLTFWVGGGALIGGRLLYVLPNLPNYLSHPFDLVYVNIGASIYGAFLGATLSLAIYARRTGLPFIYMLDAYALFAPIGIASYRLSCFAHSPCWGRPTDSILGVQFPGLSISRYPSDIYEGLLVLALFAILLQLDLRRAIPGLLSASFLLGYSLIRGVVDVTRMQPSFWAKIDPWIAIAVALIASIAAILILWQRPFAALRRQQEQGD